MNKKGIVDDIGMTVPKLVIAALSVLLLLIIIAPIINIVIFKNKEDAQATAVLDDIAEETVLLAEELKDKPSINPEITIPIQLSRDYYISFENTRLCLYKAEGNKLLECRESELVFESKKIVGKGEKDNPVIFNAKLAAQTVIVADNGQTQISITVS